jgi:hypothetical protein
VKKKRKRKRKIIHGSMDEKNKWIMCERTMD